MTMRKFILIAVVALTACLALNACSKQGDDEQAQEQVQKAPKPTDQT
jgi:protein involved in sex pheromone biosynthesis